MKQIAFIAIAIRITVAVSTVALALPAHAIDSIPLDQLKPGLWKVVRTIDRHDGSAEEVRQSEYCASPKKELTKMLRAATLLCKANVTKLADNKYEVDAACRLPGILSDTNYSAEVDTIGTKFGEKQHRSEKILAVRESDCKEPS
jgi:hypothetical protein